MVDAFFDVKTPLKALEPAIREPRLFLPLILEAFQNFVACCLRSSPVITALFFYIRYCHSNNAASSSGHSPALDLCACSANLSFLSRSST